MLNRDQNSILKIFSSFTITDKIKTIYGELITFVQYHNNIIEFINRNSAYQLIKNTKNRLFNMNLIPLENFPDLFNEKPNYSLLLSILRYYRIPKIEIMHQKKN